MKRVGMAMRWTVLTAGLLSVTLASAEPLQTAFTYQGELIQAGAPAQGPFDFEFALFDADTNGAAVATALIVEDILVSDGVFSVELDFGAGPFAGDQLWLEIGVREGTNAGNFQLLAPRQKLTAVPYALHAEMVAADSVSGVEIANNSITATDLADEAVGRAELAANSVDNAAILDNAVTAAKLATNSVGRTELATDAVGPDEIAANAVGTAEIISSQVQRRVAGTCDVGTYLVGINEDGTVQCGTLPVGLARTLDDAGGTHTSVVVRANGLPFISYHDVADDDLKVYDCSNPACSSGTVRTLDSTGDQGRHSSAAVATNDNIPLVSYYDATNDDLMVYRCSNSNCSIGTAATLDSTGDVGQYTSMAFRDDGTPIISYYDVTNGDLKAYDCTTPNCFLGTAHTLDSAGVVGLYTSVAVRDDDSPIISYYDATNDDLKVFDCDDETCSSGTDRTLDSAGDVGLYTSISIRADGLPIVSYYDADNGNLKVYDCANEACSNGTDRTLDSIGIVGWYTSIAIRADGLPLIAYQNDGQDDDLKVYDCADVDCSSGTARTIDASEDTGYYTSLAIRSDGLPIISYFDGMNDDLRVYSCGDARCEN